MSWMTPLTHLFCVRLVIRYISIAVEVMLMNPQDFWRHRQMAKKVTATGAKRFTTDLDRVASTIEKHYASLGIPQKFANDFCHKCDILSDRIEKFARVASEDAPAKEEETKKEASVTKTANFDAKTISKPVAGPLVKDADDAAILNGHFTQDNFSQLNGKVQSGKLSNGKAEAPVSHNQVSKLAMVMKAAMLALASEGEDSEEDTSKEAEDKKMPDFIQDKIDAKEEKEEGKKDEPKEEDKKDESDSKKAESEEEDEDEVEAESKKAEFGYDLFN